MVHRFAGFQLDRQRAELRGPDSEVVRLRPKTFAMLALFTANSGRVLTKQELMDAVCSRTSMSARTTACFNVSGRSGQPLATISAK